MILFRTPKNRLAYENHSRGEKRSLSGKLAPYWGRISTTLIEGVKIPDCIIGDFKVVRGGKRSEDPNEGSLGRLLTLSERVKVVKSIKMQQKPTRLWAVNVCRSDSGRVGRKRLFSETTTIANLFRSHAYGAQGRGPI